MNRWTHYEFVQLCSFDDEAKFFSRMGRFFASATVRRECGGYPLTDGPRYRWFIVQHSENSRVLGFISIECLSDNIRIRDGYLRTEARRRGLFRLLRQKVLDYIDSKGLACTVRVRQSCAPFLAPHGFQVQATRGNWVTMKRHTYGSAHGFVDANSSPVSGTRQPTIETAHQGHQPNASATGSVQSLRQRTC